MITSFKKEIGAGITPACYDGKKNKRKKNKVSKSPPSPCTASRITAAGFTIPLSISSNTFSK